MTCRLLAMLLCLACLTGHAGSETAAEQPDQAAQSQSMRFRRVFVPAAHREDWPLSQQKYLPVAPDEFERLLAASAAPAPDSDRPAAGPRLVRAEYEASLDGDRLTGGRGTLWVEHTSETRALLRLDPCGLAVGRAVWADDEPRRAALGLGVDGCLDLLVEQPGRLQIEWSLAGVRNAAGTLHFPLRFPACPINRLLLETPDDVRVSVDHGAVLDAGRGDEGTRRWQIEFGNRFAAELRITALDAETSRPGLAIVRERTGYDLSPRGVEVSTELDLEIHHEPLKVVKFQLDGQLQLVTAKLGEEPVPWTVAPGEDGGPARVTLRLPKPVQGTGLILRLGALAPLVTEQTWRLPRIRPEGMFWQEGSATLLVRAPLVVERLKPIGCHQTGAEVLVEPRQGESFQLQFFHPEATAELNVTETQDRVEVASGTSVRWAEEEVRATVRADFRLQAGARFELDGSLEPRWMVDTVESMPADVVDQWAVEPDAQGGRRLLVRLSRALAPGEPIRLSVGARRLGSSLGQSLDVHELAPLRFDSEASGRRLVGLYIPDGCELEYVDSAAAYAVTSESLQPCEAELLGADHSMTVFQWDGNVQSPQVRVTPVRPTFQAEVDVEVWVARNVMEETYRIRCDPESARLDRVVVWLDGQREEPLHWATTGDQGVRVSARRRMPDEPSAADLPAEHEVWELRLSPPVNEPLEIVGQRESAFSGPVSPALASVPDAETQTGHLAIHAVPGVGIHIDNRRLRQVPPESLPSDRYPTARAVYRYDPWREGGRIAEPAVIVSGSPAERPGLALVWEARLDSRFDTDGDGCHVAVFHVENLGEGALHVRLPAELLDGAPVGVWVDRERIAAERAVAETPSGPRNPAAQGAVADGVFHEELRVPLPVGRRYPTVTISFASKQRRFVPMGVLRAPWPDPDVAILSRSWSVWLPPGYVAYGGQRLTSLASMPLRNWSERLLGPLGRPAGQAAFDPLAAEDWLAARGDAHDRVEAVQRVEGWMQEALASARGSEAAEDPAAPVSLREIMTSEAIAGLRRKLLVDRGALAYQGVSPADPIAGQAMPVPPGNSLFTSNGLALLLCRDAALLTTQTVAARLRPHLDALPIAQVWWVRSRSLAGRLAHAAQIADDLEFIPAATWILEPEGPPSPWLSGRLPGHEPADQFGWQAVVPPDGRSSAAVRYYHGHSLQLAGSIALLLAVSGGWWLAKNRMPVLLATACIAGLAGLAAPEPFVPTASGIVLGALFCLAFRLVHGRLAPRVRSRRVTNHLPPNTVSATVPWGLALLVAATLACWSTAARGEGEQPEPGTSMHRVFIPVDDERQPVGGKVYLPEPLFAELHRLAAVERGLPQGWLLGEAIYRGEMLREPVGDRFLVDEIRAQFDLHVFTPAAKVQIPLERGGANLLPDGVSLDGRPVQVEWSADNQALVVEVAEPGQYQVELRMRPRMRAEPPAGFDLSIPPLPMAQLEFVLPSGAPAIEVPTARGAVRREDAPDRVVAELGPSESLSVRWASEGSPAGGGPAIDIEELLWLKVQPGSVLVEAKWKMTILEGQLRRLRIATDPRMRLLPLEGDQSPAVRTLPDEDELQRLELQWPDPIEEPTVLTARFLLTDTSSVGNLWVPQLELLDGRITRRWMAVSVADALQFEQGGNERLTPVPLPEFLSAWETEENTPGFVYRLPAGVPDWTLTTRPRESKTSVEKELTLRFAEHTTEVMLKADLVTASGYSFQYRITAPEAFEVARVALLAEGVDRAVRWSQDGEGGIHVFLTGPASEQQQLIVQGRLPGAPRQPVSIPVFRIEDGHHVGTTLHIMRKPGVLVEVRSANGLSPIDVPATEAAEPSAWLPVGSYRLGPEAESAASVIARANQPRLAGREILRLSADDGVWHARWECRLNVSDGLLEEFVLDAPANWGNRFRTSDGLELRNAAAKGPRQELALRPEQPVSGRWLAWVSGRLQFAPGEPVAVPDIALQGDHAISRFVILPHRIDGHPVDWQLQGLQPVALAEVAPELAPEHGVLAAFRVLGSTFLAELPELSKPSLGAGRVYLAEYAVQWQEGGTLRGAARFDVEPGAPAVCTIRFPENSRPVLLKVDGIPAQLPKSPESGVFEVQLGPPGIPQRIEAVFEAGVKWPVRGRLELAAPRVLEMPVEETLWTFAFPPSQVASVRPDGQQVTAVQAALMRLERLGSLLDRYSTVASGDSSDTLRWYEQWLRRWLVAREMARMEADRLPEETERMSAIEHIETLTKLQSDVAARLGAADTMTELLESGENVTCDCNAWHATLLRGQRLVHHRAAGSLPEIAVDGIRSPAAPVVSRVVAGAGWIALLSLVAVGLRRGLLVESFRRWPQATGVLAGLAWWLWLSPSALGLLLVAACIATSLRSGWRSISGAAPDGSAVSISRS